MKFLCVLCCIVLWKTVNGIIILDDNGQEAKNEERHFETKEADQLVKSKTIRHYRLMIFYEKNCTSLKTDYNVTQFYDSSISITNDYFSETNVTKVYDYFKTDKCVKRVLYDPVTDEEIFNDTDNESLFPIIDEGDTQNTPNYIEDKIMNIRKFYNETNYRGKGMTVHYIDGGFYPHEDINNTHFNKKFNCTPDLNCNHGVWSIGVMAAADNGMGIVGIAPEANFILYSAHQLMDLLKNAKPGDIVGASMSVVLNKTNDMPLFCINSHWEVFERLLNKNIAVLVSAGNTNSDISKYNLCNKNDTRIVVSTACDHSTGKKLGFSSYNYQGSMFCNWGNNVETTGSSVMHNKINGTHSYNKKYSGTSSSNPINVGLFTLLQGYAKQNGFIISLKSLVEIFKKTGKQISKKNVGKQIDLYAAYQLVKTRVFKRLKMQT